MNNTRRKRRSPLRPTILVQPAPLSNTKAQSICTAIAGAFGYTLADVLYGGRYMGLLRARRGCYYALRERGLSLTEIGELLGVHHTTVLSGARRAEAILKRFPEGELAEALRSVSGEARASRAEQVRRAIAELQTELGALEIEMGEAAE